MPENSWSEQETNPEFALLDAWLPEQAETEAEDVAMQGESSRSTLPIMTPAYKHYGGRRRKAVMTLTLVWGGTIALHMVSWGTWVIWGLSAFMGLHALRVLLAKPNPIPEPLTDNDVMAGSTSANRLPHVALLVAAKNEEAVIENLVESLMRLDYPNDRYEVWVVNDNSSDRTPELLNKLAQIYPTMHVIHRSEGAAGGKSGALNQALSAAQGEIIGVFDADAQVSADLLRRVIPLFQRVRVGAVQMRKAILDSSLGAPSGKPVPDQAVSDFAQLEVKSGSPTHSGQLNLRSRNLWIQGQMLEMIVDCFVQQQRIAIGGIGELRGNGQFIRRSALAQCGGWNEETITDDLDLTFQLHLNQWDIDSLPVPAVGEEGVTRGIDLWHQRNRWGEGGFQRYLDYWPALLQNRLGTRKSIDMVMFLISQYLLSIAGLPDVIMALASRRLPLLMPVTALTIALSVCGIFLGIRRYEIAEKSPTRTPPVTRLLLAIQGTVYMLHWFAILGFTITRMSLRPKRLKWVKTIHRGVNAA